LFTSNKLEIEAPNTFFLFFVGCLFTFPFIELFIFSKTFKEKMATIHGLHPHISSMMLFHLFCNMRLVPFLFVSLDLMH
jgi:hypothetical protein